MKTTYASRVLTVLTLLSIVGFLKSFFFASSIVRSAYPISIHIHGASLLGWGLLAILQAQLVSARKIKVHKFLGWLSIGLVATAVLSSYAVVRASVAHSFDEAARTHALGFTLVQTTDLLLFVGFFVAGIVFRRRRPEHLSFVIAATVALLAPSIVRAKLLWLAFVPVSPLLFAMAFMDLSLLALWITADSRGRGSRRVFATCLAVMLTIQIVRSYVGRTETWLGIAEKIFVTHFP